MASLLAQASSSRPVQLAATAAISSAVAVGLLLGYQSQVHSARLRRLKRSVAADVVLSGAEDSNGARPGSRRSIDKAEEEETDPEERRALALARRAQAGDYAEDVILEQLTRNRAFLTPEGLQKVREAVVVVVGCGGVGSHCTAALARSGVARIRLVDFDNVSLSSLNRHAVATLADVGRPKVRVLARRLLAVAPWVRFDERGEKFDAASAGRLLGPWDDGSSVSFIVDAIDNIDTKVELLRYCHANGLSVIASMGAGTKSDPTRVVVGDIGSSAEDRLSRATRRRLKLLGITSGIPAVYSTETSAAGDGKAALLPLSDEQFAQGKAAVRELGALPDFRVRILPVLGTMPAVFGYTLANHILLTLSSMSFPLPFSVYFVWLVVLTNRLPPRVHRRQGPREALRPDPGCRARLRGEDGAPLRGAGPCRYRRHRGRTACRGRHEAEEEEEDQAATSRVGGRRPAGSPHARRRRLPRRGGLSRPQRCLQSSDAPHARALAAAVRQRARPAGCGRGADGPRAAGSGRPRWRHAAAARTARLAVASVGPGVHDTRGGQPTPGDGAAAGAASDIALRRSNAGSDRGAPEGGGGVRGVSHVEVFKLGWNGAKKSVTFEVHFDIK